MIIVVDDKIYRIGVNCKKFAIIIDKEDKAEIAALPEDKHVVAGYLDTCSTEEVSSWMAAHEHLVGESR